MEKPKKTRSSKRSSQKSRSSRKSRSSGKSRSYQRSSGKSRSSQRSSRKSRSSQRSSIKSRSLKQSSTIKENIYECPKTPSHQVGIDRNSEHWLKVNTLTDLIMKKGNHYIKTPGISTGLYVMIVLKENPEIIYLLKEFDDFFYNRPHRYPVDVFDDDMGMIGHSSVYTSEEMEMEWTKENTARMLESEASAEKNKKKKKKLLKQAKRIRGQCLLMYAGQLYYDTNTGIVLWSNHSGHFQAKAENRYLVNLPDNLFIAMSSKKIQEKLEEHMINSPPTSPVSSPGKVKKLLQKFGM
jgi:hypothetical protein